MFTQEELKNLLALINLAPISGKDAVVVALLQQKITSLTNVPNENKTTGKGDSESTGAEVNDGKLQKNRGKQG